MNGTKNIDITVLNNTNVFQKSKEEKNLLKKLKNKNILYFQNKIVKPFDSRG